jgi:6-phosphogluconolactonase
MTSSAKVIHPGDRAGTLRYCAQQIVDLAEESILSRGQFAIALSGGSTPKAIYTLLASPEYSGQIDWTKVLLFWSDERSVPPDHPDSNYRMAMEAGFGNLAIPKKQIFRMEAERAIEEHALAYERLLLEKAHGELDLVMLGMGPDGHTASLFPRTEALHSEGRLVVANYVPQQKTWRMTFTYEAIARARHVSIYVLGDSKREMVREVLHGPYQPDDLPIQRVGSSEKPALWIVDFPPP